jgi:DNA-directed RNA polymerase specialized sigma24 family protein
MIAPVCVDLARRSPVSMATATLSDLPDPSAVRHPPQRRTGAPEAAQAARLAREGATGQDRAAALLLSTWGARLLRYFATHGRASDSVAEELTSDAILQFVLQPLPASCPPDVWLWTIARNGLIDWARAQDAFKRGGTGGKGGGATGRSQGAAMQTGRIEITLDDDEMLALLDTHHGHVDLAPWIRDCVHKAAAWMEREEPRHAQVLWMVAQGWSAEEVAIHFGAPPDAVNERQRSAARDRIYRACQCAREHFAHCQE